MAKSMMDQDMLKVLYSEEQIRTRVQEMGDTLYEQFKDRNPLFLGVLKGSFIFMADIVRACQIKSDIEFIAVSSYQNGTSSSGVVQITHDLQQDITGREIVVIEDILDSGNTLYFLKNYFLTKGAKSVTVVTLLDKPARRVKPITADLAGFEVPDEFVVGYGLDYAQQSADCRRFYENPRENADVLTKYDVHYIYVSDYERAEFDVDLDALDETYELIYENDDVRIYDTGWRETP